MKIPSIPSRNIVRLFIRKSPRRKAKTLVLSVRIVSSSTWAHQSNKKKKMISENKRKSSGSWESRKNWRNSNKSSNVLNNYVKTDVIPTSAVKVRANKTLTTITAVSLSTTARRRDGSSLLRSLRRWLTVISPSMGMRIRRWSTWIGPILPIPTSAGGRPDFYCLHKVKYDYYTRTITFISHMIIW